MNEIISIPLTLLAGIILGTFFFLGLWWTIKKSVSVKTPAIWFFSSLIVRLGVVLIGFYFVSHNHWERMLLCLIGFLIARVFITRYMRIHDAKANLHMSADNNKGGG